MYEYDLKTGAYTWIPDNLSQTAQAMEYPDAHYSIMATEFQPTPEAPDTGPKINFDEEFYGPGAGPNKPEDNKKLSKYEIAALTAARTLPALLTYLKPQRVAAPAVSVGGGRGEFSMPAMFGAQGDKERYRALLARYLMGR